MFEAGVREFLTKRFGEGGIPPPDVLVRRGKFHLLPDDHTTEFFWDDVRVFVFTSRLEGNAWKMSVKFD